MAPHMHAKNRTCSPAPILCRVLPYSRPSILGWLGATQSEGSILKQNTVCFSHKTLFNTAVLGVNVSCSVTTKNKERRHRDNKPAFRNVFLQSPPLLTIQRPTCGCNMYSPPIIVLHRNDRTRTTVTGEVRISTRQYSFTKSQQIREHRASHPP